MKMTILAFMLLATFVAPVGSARADSDEWRDGYWEHSHKHGRDRGGSHEGRHEGWDQDHGGGDTADGGDTVDEATDGHTGTDD